MIDFITVTTREWKYSQECVKTVERMKEYKAQLELLLRLNDKVEDTSKLTIVGLAAVRDTINGLQKCMVGKK